MNTSCKTSEKQERNKNYLSSASSDAGKCDKEHKKLNGNAF